MARRLNKKGHEIKVEVMKCDCDEHNDCDESVSEEE